jgi:uncharacterized damage-inducible protein DinB
MSLAETSIVELVSVEQFFNTSTKELTEELSSFAPTPDMMTAAQQIAHAAQSIDWFVDGAFGPSGFSMDFDDHFKDVLKVTSIGAAREWFAKAIAAAKEAFGTKTDEELLAPLPEGPIMGGAPRYSVIGAITDHTAHHRGALTVYARLSGKVPPMPYM